MAVNSIYSYTNKFRIGGIATGLDTDELVNQLMRVESIPLNKIKQKKQLAEWKRDDYRSIISLLQSFKNEFFDILKPDNYMLSQSTYKKFTTTSTNSNFVTATGTSSANPGSYKVTVKALATADKAVSSGTVTRSLTSVNVITSGAESDVVKASGKKINITLDGVTREITLGTYTETTTVADLAADLQAKIDSAFGSGKVTVTEAEGRITFATTGGASKITISSGSTSDGLANLGFTSKASNRINTSETLENLASQFASGLTFDSNGNLVFSINSKEFKFSKTTTLSSMLNTINSDPTANVNIIYDEVTDKFIITSKQTGDGDNIRISQKGGTFFSEGATAGAIKIDVANPIVEADGGQQGRDAEVTIDGETIKRSSNTFTVNGVTYTLLKEHTADNPYDTITVAQDVDGIYERIKNFVDKYNEMISTINSKLSEKYDRSYQPLTDEQKEQMTEDQIKKWEEKAKTGLLRNDQILQNIVYNMRRALSDSVQGVSINLSSIGITTGSYEDKGKLKIDEQKLKEAIRNNPDEVMKLFSQKSSSVDSNIDLTSEQRNLRYKEEGLAYRLFDILEDNIRTTRDKYGNKGLLLEKAGAVGDASEYKNALYKEISDYNEKIAELTKKLITKETQYYAKFAAMESAIAKMNAQSNWLSMQFSSYYG